LDAEKHPSQKKKDITSGNCSTGTKITLELVLGRRPQGARWRHYGLSNRKDLVHCQEKLRENNHLLQNKEKACTLKKGKEARKSAEDKRSSKEGEEQLKQKGRDTV